jgi:hypothetical protein
MWKGGGAGFEEVVHPVLQLRDAERAACRGDLVTTASID